jgi:ElaB/YqjD/DUF883 family membrane-anchored ribosome-binding protein
MADTISGGDHWAVFGDGNMAQIIDSKDYIKKSTTGKKFTKFIFIPSKRILQTYNIETDVNGMDVREYHWTKILWLEKGVTRSRCLVFCDYVGGDTPLTRRDAELRDVIEDMEQMVKSAQAAKNRAYQELDMERQQKLQSVTTQVKILQELAKARGKARYADDLEEETEVGGG